MRTLLSVWMGDGPAVLEAFAKGRGIKVSVRGPQTHIQATFPAGPQLVIPAQEMLRICPTLFRPALPSGDSSTSQKC